MPLIDPLAVVFTIVIFIPGHIVLTISMEEVVSIVVVVNVNLVIHPLSIVVIHMIDQQTFARTAEIPILLLAVL